jgi:hypothetical protein
MNRKILIAVFFATIMLVIPFTNVAGNPNQISNEQSNGTILPFMIDPDIITTEQAIEMLEMALEDLSTDYADDPDFQQLKATIEEEIMFFNENGTWRYPIFCALLFLGLLYAVAAALGWTLTAVLDYVHSLEPFQGGFQVWIYDLMVAGHLTIVAIILFIVFLKLCPTNEDGSSTSISTVTISDVLEIEGIDISDLSVDCGCGQTSESSTNS